MLSKKHTLIALAACVIAITCASPAYAWHDVEHRQMTRYAIDVLPDSIPIYFRNGADTITHCSIDPDVIKIRDTPQLHNAESPEHYMDIELIAGLKLPRLRYTFIKYCCEHDLDPSKVGFVPYATAEWTQRLAVAFAEHRKWPDNPHIKNKSLIYAGILAHYAQDLDQPLHTTIHYDGIAAKNGNSPHTGIHEKIDGLIRKLTTKQHELPTTNSLKPYDNLFNAIIDELNKSHSLVNSIYAMKNDLPEWPDKSIESKRVADFAVERMNASVTFTAQLYLTAWHNSANIKLKTWLKRENNPTPQPDTDQSRDSN